MFHRIKTLAALFLLCLAPVAMAGGKNEDTPVISFHIETESTDNPKMIFPQRMEDGKVRYFRRLSDVSSKDVAAFGPFPDDGGGETYGIALQLKPAAARRLSAITAVSDGKWMVARVNGRVVDAVIIDKQIEDGYLIIWRGVTLAEINVYDKIVPRIGASDVEKKKKKNK
jgi:hypothetical protein